MDDSDAHVEAATSRRNLLVSFAFLVHVPVLITPLWGLLTLPASAICVALAGRADGEARRARPDGAPAVAVFLTIALLVASVAVFLGLCYLSESIFGYRLH